jgi:hypothetical protein
VGKQPPEATYSRICDILEEAIATEEEVSGYLELGVRQESIMQTQDQ